MRLFPHYTKLNWCKPRDIVAISSETAAISLYIAVVSSCLAANTGKLSRKHFILLRYRVVWKQNNLVFESKIGKTRSVTCFQGWVYRPNVGEIYRTTSEDENWSCAY